MIGAEDPEYQRPDLDPGDAAMQVYSYAEELAQSRRLQPKADLVSVLIDAEVEGEKLDQLELDLFFLLLIVAGNETTRNLMSGAMPAFFNTPISGRSCAVTVRYWPTRWRTLRYSPVIHFRRTAAEDTVLGGQEIEEGDKVVFWHTSANRHGRPSTYRRRRRHAVAQQPHRLRRRGRHVCLGANLARMEITVMFDRLLERLPDIRLAASAAAAVQLHQRHQAPPSLLRALGADRGRPGPGPLRWAA